MKVLCSCCGGNVLKKDSNGPVVDAWVECSGCIEAQYDFVKAARSLARDLEYCLTNNKPSWDLGVKKSMEERLVELKKKLELTQTI